MSTFVSVGTGPPFPRLLNEVARLAALGMLPQPVIVQHGNTPFHSAGCSAVAFLDRPEFDAQVAAAELVITQAGAGTALQAMRAGKVPVLMPRKASHGEVVDDHQAELAELLAAKGRAVLAEQPDELPGAIARARQLQAGAVRHRGERGESMLVDAVRKTLEAWQRKQ